MSGWATGPMLAVAFAAAAPAAAQTPQNCAASIVIDASGTLNDATVAGASCQAGGMMIAAVCSNDTAKPHTVRVAAKMFFKATQAPHAILKKDVEVTVGPATGSTPACVAGEQPIFDKGNFGIGKKPYGHYLYLIELDNGSVADPDLDVAPPSSILNGQAPRRGPRAAGQRR